MIREFPLTPDVSKIVTNMWQTVDGVPVPHFTPPSNAVNGVYLVGPTSVLNAGTGLIVSNYQIIILLRKN